MQVEAAMASLTRWIDMTLNGGLGGCYRHEKCFAL